MNNYIFNIILVVIIVIILIVVFSPKTEGFYGYPANIYANKYCGDCGKRDRFSCSSCSDCGYCFTPDGTGECVSGDKNGPYFRQDCQDYEYTYPYPALYPIHGSIYPYIKSIPFGSKFTKWHKKYK